MESLNLGCAVTIAFLAAVLFNTAEMINAFQVHYQVIAFPQGYNAKNYTFGTISSIQNNEDDKPAWIVTGIWKGNFLLSSHSSNTNEVEEEEIMMNRSTAVVGSPSPSPLFNAQFQMVSLDGTAVYNHTITNFALTNISQPNELTIVFNGTTTASMKEGPVIGLPTSIAFMQGKVISIKLDPSKVDDHFGTTPIYGLVMYDDVRSN